MDGFIFSGPFLEAELDYLPALVRTLTGRGLGVSIYLEGGPHADLDKPGKDSFRHREAGAREVVLSSAHRWALLRGSAGPETGARLTLLSRLSPTELVLLRRHDGPARPYLTLYRAQADFTGDGPPLAVVGDHRDQRVDALAFGWEDLEQIASLLAGQIGMAETTRADRTAP